MSEFDIYLKLGNELEKENKILMACLAYLVAINTATEEQKQTIKNYVKPIEGKIQKNNEERNQELKDQLLKWKVE